MTEDKATVKKLVSLGLKAVTPWSLRGIWFGLRAKYYFFTHGVAQLNFWTSRNAVLFNLWHGTPLKKTEWDDDGFLGRIFRNPTWKDRFIEHPSRYVRSSYVLSSSPYVSEYSRLSAFRVTPDQCVLLGYPRLDVLAWSREAIRKHLERIQDTISLAIWEQLLSFKRIVFYLPTFRETTSVVTDTKTDFLTDCVLPLDRLLGICAQAQAALLIKPHPLAYTANRRRVMNLSPECIVMPPDLDLYPFLAITDILLTDYSSVMFDFMLTRRPIVLYLPDRDSYLRSCRSFYFPLEEVGIRTLVETPEALCQTIKELLSSELSQNYTDDSILRFNQFQDGNACQRICDFIFKLESAGIHNRSQ